MCALIRTNLHVPVASHHLLFWLLANRKLQLRVVVESSDRRGRYKTLDKDAKQRFSSLLSTRNSESKLKRVLQVPHATMVDLLERLDVMFKQEESVYRTEDYMDPDFQSKIASICDANNVSIGPYKPSLASIASLNSGINDVWREKICEWSYQVIDHFDFSREVVCVSMHYLDRFLAKRPVSKKVFQLAAMTTLFLAIKLFEPGRLSMSSMIELSRGYFTTQQMMAMEMSVLR